MRLGVRIIVVFPRATREPAQKKGHGPAP